MVGRGLRGRAARRTRAAIGHAVGFPTGGRSCFDQGLTADEAVALMASLVETSGLAPRCDPALRPRRVRAAHGDPVERAARPRRDPGDRRRGRKAFDDAALWPAGEWESWQTPLPLKPLVRRRRRRLGAARAARPRPRGRRPRPRACRVAHTRALETWGPDLMRGIQLPSAAEAGLLTGESGILMTAWLVEPTAERAERLHERIRENADNEAIEIMWGAPGTMLAAAELHRRTGEARWASAWRESAGKVLAARTVDGLWESRPAARSAAASRPRTGSRGTSTRSSTAATSSTRRSAGCCSARRTRCCGAPPSSRTASPPGRPAPPTVSSARTARSVSSGAPGHRAS